METEKLNEMLEKMTINEKTALRNKLEAEIEAFFNQVSDINTIILVEEVKNLIDRVGEGFVEGDYYAPDRYYSRIPGVKNIRIRRPATISVKLYSYVPLPEKITLDGEEYKVECFESSLYQKNLIIQNNLKNKKYGNNSI